MGDPSGPGAPPVRDSIMALAISSGDSDCSRDDCASGESFGISRESRLIKSRIIMFKLVINNWRLCDTGCLSFF